MFGFLKRNKPTIEAISIPDFGWELVKDTPEMKQWIDPQQTQCLTVNFFSVVPDLPSITNVEELRQFFRPQLVGANGGIIQVDIGQKEACPYVKTIFKIPQQPTGMTYLGSLIFPFKKYSYVAKIQAIEVGITGVRDTIIADKLLAAGAIEMGENGYEGWFKDPYLPDFEGGTPMNLSEVEAYDAQFASHPLSQVRQVLRVVEEEIKLDAVLQKLDPF